MQYIASYIVLKSYLYKHHWLSMFINIFCVLISLIMDIIMIKQNSITDYQYYIFILMRLLRVALFSFENVYSKKSFDYEFLSPYSLLLFKAVYETIFLGIFSIPFIFVKIKEENVNNESIFVGFKQYLTGIKILYSFLLYFCEFFYRLFIMLIIDRFSPNHLPLAHILDSIGLNITEIIRLAVNSRPIGWIYYSIFVVYIFLFIAAMIHNEIFIINKWGLNEKTKFFLDIKLNEEMNNESLLPRSETVEDGENENIEKNGILLEDIKIE